MLVSVTSGVGIYKYEERILNGVKRETNFDVSLEGV